MADDIHLSYYCRDSISGITKMAYKNGMWNVITMKLCPGSMGIRHFIPFAFVVSLSGLLLLSFLHWIFFVGLCLEFALYISMDALFSVKSMTSMKELFMLMILFPFFHVSYGFGSLVGVFKLFSKKYRDASYKPQSI